MNAPNKPMKSPSMEVFHAHSVDVAGICSELGVKRLSVFGSATGPAWGPESDIDILVRFDRGKGELFGRYFDLKDRLEEIFSRRVDLVMEDSIRNPYFSQSVEQTRVILYAA